MRNDFVESMTNCDTNGKWDASPYEEFVGGSIDFLRSRMLFAELHGYRCEHVGDGTVRIYEAEIDFLNRTTTKRPPKHAQADEPERPPATTSTTT